MEKQGKTCPAEGPNTERGRTSMSSQDTMNPNGGVHLGRVKELFNPNEYLLERILSKENMEGGTTGNGKPETLP
jgi:hypothetical protein